MNTEQDDYLWDGTGKVDSQIQELENILGSLRHKGAAPKLPTRTKSVYTLAPMLAIAASILLVLGVGAWIGLRSHVSKEPTNNALSNPVVTPTADNDSKQVAAAVPPTAQSIEHVYIPKKASGVKVKSVGNVSNALRGMSAEEIREGKEAKAQLMLAMRITSVKLNEARKKVQEDSHAVKS
jgi:hypothetical protein